MKRTDKTWDEPAEKREALNKVLDLLGPLSPLSRFEILGAACRYHGLGNVVKVQPIYTKDE